MSNNSGYYIFKYDIKQPNKTKLPLHFLNGNVCYYNISYKYKEYKEIVDIGNVSGLVRVNVFLKNIIHKMINHFLLSSITPIEKEKIVEVLKEDSENAQEWVTVNPIF